MSSAVISRGTTAGTRPAGVCIVSGSATGEGATGVEPAGVGMADPPAVLDLEEHPPARRMDRVGDPPPAATWAGLWMPGMFGYVWPTAFGVVPPR